jgi:hypothetical protein
MISDAIVLNFTKGLKNSLILKRFVALKLLTFYLEKSFALAYDINKYVFRSSRICL